MTDRIQVPKGTFDVLGDDALKRDALLHVAKGIFERAGYAQIETPTFEATELFARGVGASTDIVQKEMYSFTDAGGRSLTLRPEGTAPVCRAYMEHGMHKRPQPVKFWYASNFFRAEAPQRGRYRQFSQLGTEVIGSDDPAVDAEVIILLAEILEAIGAQGISLLIGSLGSQQSRGAYRAKLQDYLRAHEDQLSAEVRDRIDLNPLRAFDADDRGTQAVMRDAPRLLDHLDPVDREHFEEVKRMLDAVGIAYEIDTTLVRGLDYYTRTLFEFTSSVLDGKGVGGGGRYDGLMEQLGGPPTPGCGWGAGIERMIMSSQQAAIGPPPVDLYVAAAEPDQRVAAFKLASDARRTGHSAQVELARRSIKGVFKHADRIGARYVAVLGPDGAALKDLESGEQQTVTVDSIMHHIRGNQI